VKDVNCRVRTIVVVHLSCGDEEVELRPAFDELFEGLDFGDVCHLLVETAEGFIMVDVIRYVVEKIFEVGERAFEVGFNRCDVLQCWGTV
jgi:hypothetical protein